MFNNICCIGHHLVETCSKEWRFVEYFAGEAHVSQECRLASYCGVSLDLVYGGKAMDMLTAPGMATLDWDEKMRTDFNRNYMI